MFSPGATGHFDSKSLMGGTKKLEVGPIISCFFNLSEFQDPKVDDWVDFLGTQLHGGGFCYPGGFPIRFPFRHF
jgi:hypothetical protein